MNQVTPSRYWYCCGNEMTDFVVSRSNKQSIVLKKLLVLLVGINE